MKIAILGDTHHGMRGDSLEFHRYYEKFYDTVFFPYLIENKIDTVFQLGDLFDRRKFINFNSLYLCRKYFFDVLRDNNIRFYTLLGNHDIAYRNTLEVNSSQLLLNEYKNITIYDDFNVLNFDGVDIDIVPWLCSENEADITEKMKQSKSQICFGHFEIKGFETMPGEVSPIGLDKSFFTKYDMVLSGHFHHKSDDGQIYYVGTPGEMTWSDYNDPRGFQIFDTSTRELTFIQNPYRMFHKIRYDDEKQDFEYWKAFDFESYKQTYVKVIVINKQNPYLFDNVLDNLYKANVSDISVVEDFTDTTNIIDDKEIIDQAEDTMTILGKYIDNLTLNVESDKIKTLMRELYVEALNTENTD
jgi:DNA repair exonuclease SbcCD nuclease subunit